MTAMQLPLSLAQRHNNQQLFSDHYLNVTLSGRPEWELLAHDAHQALARIASIVHASVVSDNEAQTEEDLIRLRSSTRSPAMPSAEAQRRPLAQLVGDRSGRFACKRVR